MTWDVGGARVTRVPECEIAVPVDFFPEASAADVAASGLGADYVDADGQYKISIHSYLIEAGGQRILVDTCVGNAKDRPLIPPFDHIDGPFLARLAGAGVEPADIDIVVCTHLHVDHVGWNTRLVDGQWVPTFPRARYLFGAADIGYWAKATNPLHTEAFADSVRPVLDAGLVEAVARGTTLAGDVALTMTPGHTPGHMSVWIGDQCVITGDVMHHPIQCRHADWTGNGDLDPDLARSTRNDLLTTAAARGALVLGTHFGGTSAGRVTGGENGFEFVPDVG